MLPVNKNGEFIIQIDVYFQCSINGIHDLLDCKQYREEFEALTIKGFQVLCLIFKAVADGPVGPVLAGPTFSQGKNKILFYARKIINKTAKVIFGLARLVILQ